MRSMFKVVSSAVLLWKTEWTITLLWNITLSIWQYYFGNFILWNSSGLSNRNKSYYFFIFYFFLIFASQQPFECLEFHNIKLCSLGIFSPVHWLHWIDGCKRKFPRTYLISSMWSSDSDFGNLSESQCYLIVFLPKILCGIYCHVFHAFTNNMNLHEKMAQ